MTSEYRLLRDFLVPTSKCISRVLISSYINTSINHHLVIGQFLLRFANTSNTRACKSSHGGTHAVFVSTITILLVDDMIVIDFVFLLLLLQVLNWVQNRMYGTQSKKKTEFSAGLARFMWLVMTVTIIVLESLKLKKEMRKFQSAYKLKT